MEEWQIKKKNLYLSGPFLEFGYILNLSVKCVLIVGIKSHLTAVQLKMNRLTHAYT